MFALDVTLSEDITDKEILAVVSSLVHVYNSAKIKNDMDNQRLKINNALEFRIDLAIPEGLLQKGLAELLQKTLPYTHTINSDSRLERYVFKQKLSAETMYSIAKTSRRSLAQAAGILLGGEANSLVDLSGVPELGPVDPGLCLIDSEEYNLLAQHVIAVHHVEMVDSAGTYAERIRRISKAAFVIASCSFETYVAACLGIPCLEVFKDEEELSLLSKWSSVKYAAILVKDLEYVYIPRLQKLWKIWETLAVDNKKDLVASGVDGL